MATFTSEAMIDALKATNGLVSLAARKIGCAPKTIYQRAKTVASVQQAITDSREELVDIAELALRACLTAKESWAVAFVLKTLGKGRGYVERQEVDVTSKGEQVGAMPIVAINYRTVSAPLTTGPIGDPESPGPAEVDQLRETVG